MNPNSSTPPGHTGPLRQPNEKREASPSLTDSSIPSLLHCCCAASRSRLNDHNHSMSTRIHQAGKGRKGQGRARQSVRHRDKRTQRCTYIAYTHRERERCGREGIGRSGWMDGWHDASINQSTMARSAAPTTRRNKPASSLPRAHLFLLSSTDILSILRHV